MRGGMRGECTKWMDIVDDAFPSGRDGRCNGVGRAGKGRMRCDCVASFGGGRGRCHSHVGESARGVEGATTPRLGESYARL